MNQPIVLFALSFAAGAALGRLFLFFPWTSICIAAAISTIAIVFFFLKRSLVCLLTAIPIGVMLGFFLTIAAVFRLPADHYAHLPLDGSAHTASGKIASPIDRDPGRIAFTLELERVDGIPASGMLRVTVQSENVAVGYGDRISALGKLRAPRSFLNPGGFDYPDFLARQKVYAVLYVRKIEDIRIHTRGAGIFRSIQDWREEIRGAFLRSTTGEGSAVLLAMVLGEEGGLTENIRDKFMAAGATHILSISGSHLGLVALLCFWTAKNSLFLLPERSYNTLTLYVDPRKIAAVAAAIPVTLYAFLAGGQTATIRALIMILSGVAAVLIDREKNLPAALAAAALIAVVPDPQALFDISFQLSYLSVIVIIFTVDTWSKLNIQPESRMIAWLHNALLLLLISAATGLATAPLAALYFNQISPIGIISNMIIVPLAGAVVVPLGLISGVLSLFLNRLPFADANQYAADLFVSIVALFSKMPHASLRAASPGPIMLAAFAVFFTSAAYWLRARLFARFKPLESTSKPPRWTRFGLIISVILILTALLPHLSKQKETRITFIDVGQGDSALIETKTGKVILIDGGGTRDNRFDIGRRVVAPLLWNKAVRTIDLLVLSHPHPDHMNGLLFILRSFKVREVWSSGLDTKLPGCEAFEQTIREQRIPHRIVSAGDNGVIGDIRLMVLHPVKSTGSSNTRKAYTEENNRSVVIMLETNDIRCLFPGDIHREIEAALLENNDVSADLLKIAHHGSKTSSSIDFLAAVHPKIAVISAGHGNPYRHPSAEVLKRLQDAGIRVFRTDLDGAVIVKGPKAERSAAWSELMLQKIKTLNTAEWIDVEPENWNRLWIRGWEI